MSSIERKIASITEDRRADWLFDTKAASEAVGCHPRKFGDWWRRTSEKLIDLYVAQPGPLAAELAGLIALAEVQRQRREVSTAAINPAGAIAAAKDRRVDRPIRSTA